MEEPTVGKGRGGGGGDRTTYFLVLMFLGALNFMDNKTDIFEDIYTFCSCFSL